MFPRHGPHGPPAGRIGFPDSTVHKIVNPIILGSRDCGRCGNVPHAKGADAPVRRLREPGGIKMFVRSPSYRKPPTTARTTCPARPARTVPEDPRRRFAAVIPLALALLVAACAPTILPMKPGTSFRDCPECPEMIVVPAGSFEMGASGSEAEAMTGGGHHVQGERERPRHTVTMDRPFALGTFKVTRGDYAAFVDETRYGDIEACYRWTGRRLALAMGTDWRDPGFAQTDRDPVVCASAGMTRGRMRIG